MLYQGYIVNPDPYLLPYYKLSPFGNTEILENRSLPSSLICNDYFLNKHKPSFFYYTSNGRNALNIALKNLSLSSNDVVTVITTTQNLYISNCVTTEIEKFCKWNRTITPETKVILVNHEFGFPYEELNALKRLNIPIIEDCAYSFNSQNAEQSVGKVGDFIIYSFPKFFPIQIGGLLVSKNELEINRKISTQEKNYICNVISHYINAVDEISKRRISNYNFLKYEIEKLGLRARFDEIKDKTVPGVFMFKVPDHVNTQVLKQFYNDNGVECSVFYGESSFFLPCHHKLLTEDMSFFITLLKFYLNSNKN